MHEDLAVITEWQPAKTSAFMQFQFIVRTNHHLDNLNKIALAIASALSMFSSCRKVKSAHRVTRKWLLMLQPHKKKATFTRVAFF